MLNEVERRFLLRVLIAGSISGEEYEIFVGDYSDVWGVEPFFGGSEYIKWTARRSGHSYNYASGHKGTLTAHGKQVIADFQKDNQQQFDLEKFKVFKEEFDRVRRAMTRLERVMNEIGNEKA